MKVHVIVRDESGLVVTSGASDRAPWALRTSVRIIQNRSAGPAEGLQFGLLPRLSMGVSDPLVPAPGPRFFPCRSPKRAPAQGTQLSGRAYLMIVPRRVQFVRVAGSQDSKFEPCSGTGGAVVRHDDVALAGHRRLPRAFPSSTRSSWVRGRAGPAGPLRCEGPRSIPGDSPAGIRAPHAR